MAIVQRNVQISASPQETMALLSDASRWPDWYPGISAMVMRISPGPPRWKGRWRLRPRAAACYSRPLRHSRFAPQIFPRTCNGRRNETKPE